MMTLIIGGSGSGKSAYAEEILELYTKGRKKYYLATMKAFDEEGEKKILRHRQSRAGKGFITIEQPTEIIQVLEKMHKGEKTALLECMSNLVANEMFAGEEGMDSDKLIKKLREQIGSLKEELTHLVVVSNNVFEDGLLYDEGTRQYLLALGGINEELALLAEEVIEVAVGIPLVMKKG